MGRLVEVYMNYCAQDCGDSMPYNALELVTPDGDSLSLKNIDLADVFSMYMTSLWAS